MKNRLLLLLLALFLTAQGWAQQPIPLTEADISLLELEFAPVAAASRQTGIELPAVVVMPPDTLSNVVNRFDGIIENWLVQNGNPVQPGDILAAVRSPEALLLQQQWLAQRAELQVLAQQVSRDEQLFDKGIIAQQRLLQTTTARDIASLNLESTAVSLYQAGLDANTLADLGNGQHDVGIIYIRAPISGVLSHRAFEIGSHVTANSVVASVQRSDRLWVSAQVPARLASRIAIGDRLTLVESNETLTLKRREFEIDTLTQSIEIQAEFDNDTDQIPGKIVNLQLHPSDSALFIPASAVVRDGNQSLVYLRRGSGVLPLALELQAVGSDYHATSGIAAGDELLIRGAALVKGMQLGLGSEN